MIKHGIHLDSQHQKGYTPLHVAALCGFLECVKFLVERGCDLECGDGFRSTPLMLAAYSNNLPVVQYLIEKGASLGTELNRRLQSPIVYASAVGNVKIVDYLLRFPNNSPSRDLELYSALVNATLEGQLDMIKYLLDHGADANYRTWLLATPVHTAIVFNQPHVLEYLILRKANLEMMDRRGYTPLMKATLEGNARMVDMLLRGGAKAAIVSKIARESAMSIAIKFNHYEIIDILSRAMNQGPPWII
ncbi:hypothetical protein Aperf_G00000004733 [Anoplocephala perfoliata]